MNGAVKIAQNIQTFFALFISLTTVLGIFTAIINKIFNKRLKPIEEKIDITERDGLKRDMMIVRSNVINAAADLHRGIELTKYQYDFVFDCMNMYDDYVKKLNITNNLFTSEEEYIKERYKEFNDNK